MPAKKPESVGLPIVWIGLDDAEITYANQVLFQMGDPEHLGEFLLTFGQLHPPVLLGTPEDNRARLEAIPYVPVKVVAKLSLSEVRVRELVGLLERLLTSYEGLKQQLAPRSESHKPHAAKRSRRQR
jgi:hypothetical protein